MNWQGDDAVPLEQGGNPLQWPTIMDMNKENTLGLEEPFHFGKEVGTDRFRVQHAEGAEEAHSGIESVAFEGQGVAEVGLEEFWLRCRVFGESLPLAPNSSPSRGERNQKLSRFIKHVFREINAGAMETKSIEGKQTAPGATAEIDHLAGGVQMLLDESLVSMSKGRIGDLAEILLCEERIVQILPQARGDTGGKLPIGWAGRTHDTVSLPNRSPTCTRYPRRKSPIAIGFLPLGWTVTRLTTVPWPQAILT